jgi:deoxyribonuclease V
VIGVALRTRTGVSPVYVSAGHLMELDLAIDLILRLTPRFRLPESTRRAHALVNAERLAAALPASDG